MVSAETGQARSLHQDNASLNMGWQFFVHLSSVHLSSVHGSLRLAAPAA